MPVTQSPYYTDPAWSQTAGSLATALFSNPELRQKQKLSQAQMDEYQAAADRASAAAGYDRARTTGQELINRATTGLGDAFSSMFSPPPPPPAPVPAPQSILPGAPDNPVRTVAVAPSAVAPDAPAPFDPARQFHDKLPALLSAMVQSGHGAEADQVVRTLAAFGGDEEMARRGLVAGGASPSKDFAITPERADDIRSQGYDADYHKATAVADIGAGARRYAADQSLKGTEYGADASAGARRYAADRGLEGSEYGTDAHYGAPTSLSDIITSMVPGARITSGDRTQAEQDHLIATGATSAHNSYHVPGHGGEAIDMAPIPGMSLADAVANLRKEGLPVIEAFNESGKGRNQGTGEHWHIAIATPPRKTAGAKSTPKLSAASNKVLQDSLAAAMSAQDQYDSDSSGKKIMSAWDYLSVGDKNFDRVRMNGPSKQRLLSRAQELTMGGMAPADAALQATREYTEAVRQNGGKLMVRKPGEPFRAAPAATPQAAPRSMASQGARVLTRIPPHARRAPDGNLYALGTDGKYYKIEEQ